MDEVESMLRISSERVLTTIDAKLAKLEMDQNAQLRELKEIMSGDMPLDELNAQVKALKESAVNKQTLAAQIKELKEG